MIKHETTVEVIKDWILHQSLHSCLNCIEFNHETNQCFKYKTTPPANVIVFSCGEGWDADIPF